MPALTSLVLTVLAAVPGLPAPLPQGTWYPSKEDGNYNRCRDLRSPYDSLKLRDGFVVFYSGADVSASPITRIAGDSLFVHDRGRGSLCLILADRMEILVAASHGGERTSLERLRKKVARRQVGCN